AAAPPRSSDAQRLCPAGRSLPFRDGFWSGGAGFPVRGRPSLLEWPVAAPAGASVRGPPGDRERAWGRRPARRCLRRRFVPVGERRLNLAPPWGAGRLVAPTEERRPWPCPRCRHPASLIPGEWFR